MALFPHEKKDLINFLSTRLPPNPSAVEAFELLVERNEDVLYNQVVRVLFPILKNEHPQLFVKSQVGQKSSLNNDELFEIVINELGGTYAPTQKLVLDTLLSLGHNVTKWRSKQLHLSLIDKRPDLYQRKVTKKEAKALALMVQGAMPTNTERNPGIKDMKVALEKLGSPINSLMAQYVLVELFSVSPQHFISKPKFSHDRRNTRAYFREDLNSEEDYILDEFKKMVGLPSGKSSILMLKMILYMTVVHNFDIYDAISKAKIMTPDECRAYTSLFSKLDLTKA